jgi:hypothetical protein
METGMGANIMNGLAALLEARDLPSADGCRQAINRGAIRLVRAKAADPEPSAFGFTSLASPVTMTTGWWLHDLEQPAETVAAPGLEVALIPPGALATAAAGKVVYACELTRGILF